jgi:cytoskeletal protein CcmA (bactofilin family)
MRTGRRMAFVASTLLLAVPVVVVLATPAAAFASLRASDAPPQIVLTGRVVVASGDTVGDVVIFNGPTTIDGAVRGSVTSFHGSVTVSGTVTGDVTVFNGTVRLAAGAVVQGDLVTASTPRVDPGATVQGQQRRVNRGLLFGRIGWISQIAIWVAVTVSILAFGLLLLLFAPRAAEVVASVAQAQVGRSIGWGVALFLGIPIVAILALVTVVGIPFGVGMLLAVAPLFSLGYTASCFALGRGLVNQPRSRFLAFLAGWGIVRAVSLIPFLSGLIGLAATVYGLGILAVAARRGLAAQAVPGAMLPPPPPAPV